VRSTRRLFALSLIFAVAAAFAALSATKITMTGSYQWNRQAEQPGGLRAEFSPAGEGVWDVSFFFEFRNEKHVYSGQAHGNLENGELKGEVQNENKNRTWRFQGSCSAGNFSGTHVEIKRGGNKEETGTLRLAVAR